MSDDDIEVHSTTTVHHRIEGTFGLGMNGLVELADFCAKALRVAPADAQVYVARYDMTGEASISVMWDTQA